MTVRRSLARFAARVHAAAPAALLGEATATSQAIGAHAARRSGDLAGTVRPVPPTLGPVVESGVVVESDHAAAIEFGTSRQLPEPFIRPEVRRAAERMARTLPAKLRQATRGT